METAKNVAVQLGALISLYISISTFLILIFGIINLVLPDAADYVWSYDSVSGNIRLAIAFLAVFFPTYIYLTRTVNQARRNEAGLYHSLTKWLIYLSLLVGGFVLLGDLVVVINYFLNGEITIRFILKALALLIVVSSAFFYYWMDAKDYWNDKVKSSVTIGILVTSAVITAIVVGFFQIQAPSVVRNIRIDEQQITDLQDIQWHIELYYQNHTALPENITQAYEDGLTTPIAPAERQSYRYAATSEREYELCATFAEITPESQRSFAKPTVDSETDLNNYNWEHGVGEKCFQRTVTTKTEMSVR